MYKNYVFDLYGTLADIRTDEYTPELWNAMAKRYSSFGAKYEADELKKRYFELVDVETDAVKCEHPDYDHVDIKVEKVFEALFLEKGMAVSEKIVLDTAAYFRVTSRFYVRLYPGVDQLLVDLRKHSGVYLLTNAQRVFTWDEILLLGLDKRFDGIIISSDVECCKPDKHFFQMILDRYNLDPKETIMVGNDPNTDIRGGINAGLDTLYIHTNISPEIDYNTGCTYFIPDGNTLKMRDYLL
ncbi:MAG: HAD family hydrolase [Clostridia bacterium]|nr:HAD family hydrolase [Clostridia bacterium]